MDAEDHDRGESSSKANDPSDSKIEENQVSKQQEVLKDAQDSLPSSPISEVYSLKDYSSDSELEETRRESEIGEGKVSEIDKRNAAEMTKEVESDAGNCDRDEPSEHSDASTDVESSPKQKVESLKDDSHEKSANQEPSEGDDVSAKPEIAEQVKEVLVSESKNDKHEPLVQRNEEGETSIDPEPLTVADISPKSDAVVDVVKEVLVYESRKEDHEGAEDSKLHEDSTVIPEIEYDSISSGDESDGLEDDCDNKMTEVLVYESKKEDSEGSKDLDLHGDAVAIPEVENHSISSGDENNCLEEDRDNKMMEILVSESKKEGHECSEDSCLHKADMVIPEIENDSTNSGDENDSLEDDRDDKTNDKTSVEPPAPVEKADHANQPDGSPQSRDNESGSSESVDEDRDLVSAELPKQDQENVQNLALDERQVSEMNKSVADETPKSSETDATDKNLAQEASVGAVSSDVCHPLGSQGEKDRLMSEGDKDSDNSSKHSGMVDDSPKRIQRSFWRPLSSYFRFAQDTDQRIHADEQESANDVLQPLPAMGRIIFYTKLGCQECKEGRLYLHTKRLRYVEINIDLYPGRKLELEKMSGSSSVPKIFFNEILIGDVHDLKRMDGTGKLQEKIDYIVNEPPPPEAPLPPLSGEDDLSSSGSIDELAVVVRKMQDSIVVKDRFHKMRRITNCFLGSEAVDFISEDQYLQREEAVQFARKLTNNLFFHHVLEENLFEDGNHLYRFLNHDPIVSTQCYNIPRGIVDVKPRPITEIASRLRFLSYAIFDAYTSEDGRHVDYRSIHGSEEFARYVRTVEQLQRVEMQGISREERLAFFINLYNMMAIHAILVLGHPTGALERRRLFVDFQYVVGGCTYSLSTIQNGVLRGNQRPPYSLMKPLEAKDKRSKVALPYPEPLTHFALVCGTRSGPALRYYSPWNIDKELMDAARDFLRNGGFVYDATSNVAYVSKILKWFSIDFGKTEVEVLKHASNYLEPAYSEMLLDLLSANQLKVVYQPYDWGLNC